MNSSTFQMRQIHAKWSSYQIQMLCHCSIPLLPPVSYAAVEEGRENSLLYDLSDLKKVLSEPLSNNDVYKIGQAILLLRQNCEHYLLDLGNWSNQLMDLQIDADRNLYFLYTPCAEPVSDLEWIRSFSLSLLEYAIHRDYEDTLLLEIYHLFRSAQNNTDMERIFSCSFFQNTGGDQAIYPDPSSEKIPSYVSAHGVPNAKIRQQLWKELQEDEEDPGNKLVDEDLRDSRRYIRSGEALSENPSFFRLLTKRLQRKRKSSSDQEEDFWSA